VSLAREVTAATGRDAIVTIAGLNLVFESMTGGGSSVVYEVDDATGQYCIIPGRPRAEDITLTTTLAPYRDLGWLRKMKQSLGTRVFTITRQWTDANGLPIGDHQLHQPRNLPHLRGRHLLPDLRHLRGGAVSAGAHV
jgi:hypothetical protein